MNKISLVGLILLLLGGVLFSQSALNKSYALLGENNPLAGSLYGNGVVDILVQDTVLWMATGYGLSKATFNSQTGSVIWRSFDEDDYLSRGGVSAMALQDDSTLWIATAFDTTAQGSNLPAGGGLSYTRDGGNSWTHVAQPVDDVNEPNYAPTTTVIQNLTYDIAFVDSTIWIASFGGGLRRSDDMGKSWQVVTTDGLFFSSGAHLNHRAFSLLNVNDTLWVGTAEGISKSADNGQTWLRMTADAGSDTTISGNFIVALAYQEQEHAVWAATLPAEDTDEFRAVSRTYDGGANWQTELVDEQMFPHNFAFSGSRAYVASDQGLYWQNGANEDWQNLVQISDTQSGNEIFQEDYYSAAVADSWLWLGNSDGLAYGRIADDLSLVSWQVARSFIPVTADGQPAIYAYPSPFSPSRQYYIRFELGSGRLDEQIRIYDFGMNQVARVQSDELKPKWDGKNDAGDTVASGVYFFKAKVDGKIRWGKIVVIN